MKMLILNRKRVLASLLVFAFLCLISLAADIPIYQQTQFAGKIHDASQIYDGDTLKDVKILVSRDTHAQLARCGPVCSLPKMVSILKPTSASPALIRQRNVLLPKIGTVPHGRKRVEITKSTPRNRQETRSSVCYAGTILSSK